MSDRDVSKDIRCYGSNICAVNINSIHVITSIGNHRDGVIASIGNQPIASVGQWTDCSIRSGSRGDTESKNGFCYLHRVVVVYAVNK